MRSMGDFSIWMNAAGDPSDTEAYLRFLDMTLKRMKQGKHPTPLLARIFLRVGLLHFRRRDSIDPDEKGDAK